MRKRKITWDKLALQYFREAIRYIREDSPQNADKVKKEVLEKIRSGCAVHANAGSADFSLNTSATDTRLTIDDV